MPPDAAAATPDHVEAALPPGGPPRRRRLRRWTLVLPLLALLGAAGVAVLSLHEYDAPGPLPAPADVVVPHGDTRGVAEALARAGVVRSATALRVAALLTAHDGRLRAAEFAFPAGASLRAVLDVLRHAAPVEHRLTVPEGLTAVQVTALLDAAPALEGSIAAPSEGAVLPQTYDYERGTSRATLLARMEAAMTRALAAAWAGRATGLPLATPEQALVLASIVERETALPAERPMVAAVYLNRLRLGMRLQADPTVAYGASGGTGALDRPLSHADLDADTPWNTYRLAGLPPGPICSPGLASLEAVLHPAASDALYFVADGSGGHAFARTLEQHQANVMRWRALRGRK